MDFERYWQDCIRKDRDSLRAWFLPDAKIVWPCTNEEFTVEEFLLANCEYPGNWEGALLRVTPCPTGAITECHIRSASGDYSCHAVSFFTVEQDRIISLTEYYADDGPPPAWRTKLLNR